MTPCEERKMTSREGLQRCEVERHEREALIAWLEARSRVIS